MLTNMRELVQTNSNCKDPKQNRVAIYRLLPKDSRGYYLFFFSESVNLIMLLNTDAFYEI